ncbi:MAG: ferredoxin [Opitutaceae bacterium]|nr:ferredoxin [Opitutaceae bacterium]
MANKDDKWENNVPGKFYVDQQCIDCDLCRETAPGFFTRHDDGGHSYVFKQPTTQEEIDQCIEALEGCPVEAIGSDGDDSGAGAAAQSQANVTPQTTGEARS